MRVMSPPWYCRAFRSQHPDFGRTSGQAKPVDGICLYLRLITLKQLRRRPGDPVVVRRGIALLDPYWSRRVPLVNPQSYMRRPATPGEGIFVSSPPPQVRTRRA